MLDGLHDQKYRIERLESCMLGNGHVQFGGGPMEQGSSLYLASGLPNAATALEHNLTLLTIDTDYDRVPHLQWQLVDLKRAA